MARGEEGCRGHQPPALVEGAWSASIHSTQQERRMTILQKQAANAEQEAACSIAELTAANLKDAEEVMGPITEQLRWRQERQDPGSLDRLH